MLTLKQCKINAYAISQAMQCDTFERAISVINNVCDLDVTKQDIIKLIQLRVDYKAIDDWFNIYE